MPAIWMGSLQRKGERSRLASGLFMGDDSVGTTAVDEGGDGMSVSLECDDTNRAFWTAIPLNPKAYLEVKTRNSEELYY